MTIIERFAKKGIKGLVEGIKQQKVLCPQCSKHRKKNDEPCLSVNIEEGVCNCWNCGYSDGVAGGKRVTEHYTKKNYTKPNYDESAWVLRPDAVDFFNTRGISPSTLKANKIGSKEGKFSSRDSESQTLISFPYIKKDIVNVKYRGLKEKRYQLTRGAEICFYGMHNLFEDGELVTKKIFITEGEIDALSLYECGFRYALSVPNGANVEEEGLHKVTPKLEYLDDPDLMAILSGIDEIVLATDSDYKGRRLQEELAQRFGIEKTYSISYPSDCKDINDVLVKYGKDAVIECVLDYKPMLQGVITVNTLEAEGKLLEYYKNGSEGGMACGIPELDKIFTVQHSQLIITTGTPESFKSVFWDNLSKGLGLNYDIHTCLFSPESRPMEMHIGRLASIYNGLKLGLPEDEDRMSYEQFKEAYKWVDKHYTFISPPSNTLEEIIQLWQISLTQKGSKLFILDPYSKVNWEGENEHQFIRRMLNVLGEFAARNRVTVVVVAHPRKMELNGQKGANGMQNYKVVQPYDIAGSSSFYNSADIILSLWKDRLIENPPLRVHVQKSKLHNIAKSGTHCDIDYNFDNWRLGSQQDEIEIVSDLA